MKSTYHLDRRRPFQTAMAELKETFLDLCETNRKRTAGISINTVRIIAAALDAAEQIGPNKLAAMIDYELLPSRRNREDSLIEDAKFKIAHITLPMVDRIKGGAAGLNIHVLGALEDDAREKAGHNDIHYRLTARQYMHLAVFALRTLERNNQLQCLLSSRHMYPLLMPGPNKGTPKPRVVVNNDKGKKASNGS